MNKLVFAAIAIIAGGAANAQSLPEGFGLEGGISTLGAFASADVDIAPGLRLRTPIYFGSFSDTVDLDGSDVDAELSLTAAHVMADYYIGSSGLRVSGGLSLGGYLLSATADESLELDGTTYTGNFELELEQDSNVAPVIAIGYQRTLGANWGVSLELGGRVSNLTLSATGQEALSAADRASFEQDLADFNDDLNDFGVIPYISLGATYRF